LAKGEVMGESEADRNRLAEVFRQYNDTLVNYLAFRVKSRQEAAEIAQETYVRMLAMNDLGRITDLQSYLFRVANNLAVDRLRREQVQRRTIEQGKTAVAGFLFSASHGSSPEGERSAEDVLRLLRAAIDELPAKCRAAFILYKLHCQSYPEIARRLEVTESMVRKYVLRGLRHCQERLANDHG
jgi:RNA polymerase sigma-70 factor (ECF subfamily)